jgi:hypothetical protein
MMDDTTKAEIDAMITHRILEFHAALVRRGQIPEIVNGESPQSNEFHLGCQVVWIDCKNDGARRMGGIVAFDSIYENTIGVGYLDMVHGEPTRCYQNVHRKYVKKLVE